MEFQPALAAGVRPLPDLHQGPQRPHHRAELLRPQGRHRLGRRGLLQDAADRDAADGRDARVTVARFTEVGYDEAMRRARGLVPTLRDRADRAETARQMEKETLDDLHAGGPLPLPPAQALGRHGARRSWRCSTSPPRSRAAAPPPAGTSPTSRSITGCWRSTTSAPRQEVWGQDPDALIASGIAYPAGARPPGGRRLRRSAASGTSRAASTGHWNMLAVTVRDGERVVDHRMCLVPRGEYEIVDDWQVLGMRSTGSKSVRANEVFVPEHRALCMYDIRGGDGFPGRAEQSRIPCYRVPLAALGSHCLAGAGVGNAQAALELTIEAIKERSTNYTAMRMRDFQAVQLRVARAGAQVDAARLVIRADCLERRAHRARRPRADDRGEAALQAQRRVGDRAVHRSGGLPARAGRRQRHLRSLSDPAHLPRPARARRRTSASAGTRRADRGRWWRWAGSS